MSGHRPPPRRPALDGVRAVALVGVLAFFVGWLPGGVLGIDVFLVLTGYLVTERVIEERSATGRVDLARSWSHEVRRFIPGLALLLPVVLAATSAWLDADAFHRVSNDAVGGFFGVANWQAVAAESSAAHAIPTGPPGLADLLPTAHSTSPLAHLWAVSMVLEMVVLWPIVLLAVTRRAAKGTDRPASVARLTLIASVVATIGTIIVAMLAGMDRAGDSPGIDVWRPSSVAGVLLHFVPMFLGAAVASGCAMRPAGTDPTAGNPTAGNRTDSGERSTRAHWTRAPLTGESATGIGLVIVIGALALVSRAGGEVKPVGVIVAVLGAALLIAGLVNGGQGPISRVLSCTPLRWLGRISYGMFLWTWPVVVLLGSDRLFGSSGPALAAAQLGIALAIAVASHHLVEMPIREGQWSFVLRLGAVYLGPGVALAAIGVLLAMAWLMRGALQLDGGSHPTATIWLVWIAVAAAAVAAGMVVHRRGPLDRLLRSVGLTLGHMDEPDDLLQAESDEPDEPGEPDDLLDADSPEQVGGRVPWWVRAGEAAAVFVTPLLLLWPVTRSPGDQFVGVLDAPYNAWLGWRISEAWRSGHLLVTTIPDALYPMGVDLRLTDGILPAHVTALLDLVLANPYLAYNLAVAIGIALNVWAGRRLGQVLSDRRDVWLLTGLAFATLPALSGALNAHIAFVYAFTLPLLIRRAILIAREGEVPNPVSLGALLAVAFLCSAYHFVFGGLAFMIVVVLWRHTRARRREVIGRLVAAAVLAAIVLSPFVVARYQFDHDERAAGAPASQKIDEAIGLSSDAYGIVTPPDERWIDPPVFPQDDLGPMFFGFLRPSFAGFVLLAGLGLAVLVPRSGRRALLGAGATLFILSLGPSMRFAGGHVVTDATGAPQAWMPYRLLLAVPGLGALRAPNRAGYALGAVLAALFAIGLHRLLRKSRKPMERVIITSAALALVALTVLSPVHSSTLDISATTRTGLEEVARRGDGSGSGDMGGGGSILFVPAGCRFDDPRIIALQTIHRRPSVGCSTSTAATPWYSGLDPWSRSAALAALRCDPSHIDRMPLPFNGDTRLDRAGLDALRRDLDVRFLVVDRTRMGDPTCEGVRESVDGSGAVTDHDVISDDGDWIIVDLAAP